MIADTYDKSDKVSMGYASREIFPTKANWKHQFLRIQMDSQILQILMCFLEIASVLKQGISWSYDIHNS